jgi:outer membrane murein-binding lipoprotein Lpp
MRRLLFAAVLATASLAGCSKSDKADKAEVKHDLREMTVDEVHAGLEAKALTAVDCNSAKTRKRVGILPGAILIADEEKFTASDLPADKATKLVFYCGGPG